MASKRPPDTVSQVFGPATAVVVCVQLKVLQHSHKSASSDPYPREVQRQHNGDPDGMEPQAQRRHMHRQDDGSAEGCAGDHSSRVGGFPSAHHLTVEIDDGRDGRSQDAQARQPSLRVGQPVQPDRCGGQHRTGGNPQAPRTDSHPVATPPERQRPVKVFRRMVRQQQCRNRVPELVVLSGRAPY